MVQRKVHFWHPLSFSTLQTLLIVNNKTIISILQQFKTVKPVGTTYCWKSCYVGDVVYLDFGVVLDHDRLKKTLKHRPVCWQGSGAIRTTLGWFVLASKQIPNPNKSSIQKIQKGYHFYLYDFGIILKLAVLSIMARRDRYMYGHQCRSHYDWQIVDVH